MEGIIKFRSPEDWDEFARLYKEHEKDDLFFFQGRPVLVPFAKFLLEHYTYIMRRSNARYN